MNEPDGGPGKLYTLGITDTEVTTVALVLFTAVSGPMLALEVRVPKNAPLVVPIGPPFPGVIYVGSAVHMNRTAEVEK
jgi:hypothetical protein